MKMVRPRHQHVLKHGAALVNIKHLVPELGAELSPILGLNNKVRALDMLSSIKLISLDTRLITLIFNKCQITSDRMSMAGTDSRGSRLKTNPLQ